MSLSVHDIINDDMFDEESAMNSLEGSTFLTEEDRNYQKCLGLFMKGNPKDCIEQMFEFGMLDDIETMSNVENRVFQLYLNASDSIESFKSLGITLQNIAIDVFDQNKDRLKNEINKRLEISISNTLVMVTKYYNCCIRVLELEDESVKTKSDDVIHLQNLLKADINNYSIIVKNSEEITLLYELVRVFIFDVEIGLWKHKRSTTLYHELCNSINGLEKQMKETYYLGEPLQNLILDQLTEVNVEKTISKSDSTDKQTFKKQDLEQATIKDDNSTYSDTGDNINMLSVYYQRADQWLERNSGYSLKDMRTMIGLNLTKSPYLLQGSIITLVILLYILRKRLVVIKTLLRSGSERIIEVLRLLSSV